MTVEELIAQGYTREQAERVVVELAVLPPEREDWELRFMQEFEHPFDKPA